MVLFRKLQKKTWDEGCEIEEKTRKKVVFKTNKDVFLWIP